MQPISRPSPDQIEITVIGPGFGECIIVHLGADNWIVIDSCIDASTGEPVSLKYFRDRNINLERVVRVIATHWHDDHIRGMARQLAAFPNARFCSSSALTMNEFVASVVKYNSRHGIVAGSGASEVCEVLEILNSRVGATTPMRAGPGRTILEIPEANSGHGAHCSVKTLSPSDKQFQKFLQGLGSLVPVPFAAKKRVPDQDPNDLSVAVLVSIGQQGVLLGGDLEETGDAELGWSAVLQVEGLPRKSGRIFKIPHHGSANGNCEGVWANLLADNPIAIITPWNRSRGLPTEADVQRIRSQTHNGFITSFIEKVDATRRPYQVEKMMRETVGRVWPAQSSTGFVTARNGGKRNPLTWCIWHSDNACHLNDWKAA